MRALFLIEDGNGIQHFGSIPHPEQLRRSLSKQTGSAHVLWLAAQTSAVRFDELSSRLDERFASCLISAGRYKADANEIVEYANWLRYTRPKYTRLWSQIRRYARFPVKKAKRAYFSVKTACTSS